MKLAAFRIFRNAGGKCQTVDSHRIERATFGTNLVAKHWKF